MIVHGRSNQMFFAKLFISNYHLQRRIVKHLNKSFHNSSWNQAAVSFSSLAEFMNRARACPRIEKLRFVPKRRWLGEREKKRAVKTFRRRHSGILFLALHKLERVSAANRINVVLLCLQCVSVFQFTASTGSLEVRLLDI